MRMTKWALAASLILGCSGTTPMTTGGPSQLILPDCADGQLLATDSNGNLVCRSQLSTSLVPPSCTAGNALQSDGVKLTCQSCSLICAAFDMGVLDQSSSEMAMLDLSMADANTIDGATADSAQSDAAMAMNDQAMQSMPDLSSKPDLSSMVTPDLSSLPDLAPCAVTFAAPVNYATGAFPKSVKVKDVTGDQIADLVVADWGMGANSVSVLAGQATSGVANGTFGAKTDYAANTAPTDVVVGDVNGDTFPDLVVANYVNGVGDGASVLINKGTSPLGFNAPTLYPVMNTNSPDFVALADFNKDGAPDIVIANDSDAFPAVTVFLNNPSSKGTFGTGMNNGNVDSRPRAALPYDFDGDGNLDIVTTSLGAPEVMVQYGDGTGAFASPDVYATGQSPFGAVLADLNHDGIIDLVTANFDSSTNSVGVLVGKSKTQMNLFAANQNYSVGANPDAVATADINGDGKLDVVAANHTDGTVSVLLGNGDATLQSALVFALAGGSTAEFVSLADLNGDGKPDIVVANGAANNVSVLLNTTCGH